MIGFAYASRLEEATGDSNKLSVHDGPEDQRPFDRCAPFRDFS
jgi:hypothetical protein